MDNWNKSDAYWARESTLNGRKINDALDKHEENAEWTKISGRSDSDKMVFYENRREMHQEKAAWRGHLDKTGELITPQQSAEAHNERLIQDMISRPMHGLDDGVTIVKSSNWHIAAGGHIDSRSDIGRSDEGYHYRIDRTDNHTFDVEGKWSKPFKTQKIAERVAFAQEMSGNGEKWHLSDRRLAGIEAQERPRTQRGEVARLLDAASYNRGWTMHDKAHGRDQSVDRNIDYAKRNLEAAREIRLSTSPIVTQAERDAARDRFTGVVADQQHVVQQQRQQEQARHEGLER